MAPETDSGSSIYSKLVLYFYDFWVLQVSNKWAWKCSTSKVLLPLFKSKLGERHLDIGVGTGYYPAKGLFSNTKHITLADLNPNSLDAASRRIQAAHGDRVAVETVIADATEPLPFEPNSPKFDSVSINYLLHCMPGPPERKCKVFSAVAPWLSDEGTLTGSTILGKEAPMNWFANKLMTVYNKKGIFDNWDDHKAVFEKGLKDNFKEVECWVEGRILLFKASKPVVLSS